MMREDLGPYHDEMMISTKAGGTCGPVPTARAAARASTCSPHGQSLAQLALAWGLRDERVTSLVIGASSVDQLEQNVAALENLSLSAEELAEIDRHLTADESVDLWRQAREGVL
jgi:L-glyceraldehyde 3-phosphate reductase